MCLENCGQQRYIGPLRTAENSSKQGCSLLAGCGNLSSEKPKDLYPKCEKEKVIDSERKKTKQKKQISFKIHMQIIHLYLMGIVVPEVLENLSNGGLVLFFLPKFDTSYCYTVSAGQWFHCWWLYDSFVLIIV